MNTARKNLKRSQNFEIFLSQLETRKLFADVQLNFAKNQQKNNIW